MQTSLPASAFKHLEPYPGGNWTVSGETADTITVSYSCGDNAEVVSYILHQCRTEQDVMARCQSLMYNFDSGDEKLAAGKPSNDSENPTESTASAIELKIEQVGVTPWASMPAPTTTDLPSFCQIQANETFCTPVQGSHYVQQPTPDDFGAAPSFDCQTQIPLVYNDAFFPINNYWPIQNEIQNVQGEFTTSGEYCASGGPQWIQ